MTVTPRCRACARPIGPGDDVLFPADGGATHVRCGNGAGGAHAPSRSAEAGAPPPGFTCGLCQIPVVKGDLFVHDGDHLVHVDCHARATSGGIVADYLRRHAGEPFCHTCLATRLALRWETARTIVWALRVSSGFQVRPAVCSRCRGARVTIFAEAVADQAR